MTPEHQNAYHSGVRWSLAGSIGAAFLQFAQMAVFARWAGPEAGGDYALAATFISFLTPVAEAGLSQAVVQSAHVQPQQLATLAWVNWALGALIFSILWFLGPSLADWFERPELPGLLLLMGSSLLITPFGAQYSGLIAREMQFGASAKIEMASWGISFLITIALAICGWGAWSMALGFVLRNIVATLGCIVFGRRIISVNPFKISRLKEVSPMLRFGAFELSSRWADFFSNYLDKIIIAKWLGATALGYYNLAFTFLLLPTARLAFVVTRVAFPIFAKIRHDKAQLQSFFERSMREVILLLYPIYLAMILFSKEIIWIGFGEKWLPAAPIFVALGLAGFIRSLCAPFPQLVKGLGKPQYWLVGMLIFSAGLCLFLTLFLSQNASIESAAWSRTAAKFALEIGLLWGLAHYCGVRFKPGLQFAGKVGLLLIPVALCTLLVGMLSSDFWVTTTLKSMTFTLGILAIYGFSPLKKDSLALLQMFQPSKNQP